MATFNHRDLTVVAVCNSDTCEGSRSTFLCRDHAGSEIRGIYNVRGIAYILYKCGGCGTGALGIITRSGNGFDRTSRLIDFLPNHIQRLQLPDGIPSGIKTEFEEAETCIGSRCYRAAAGLFRSTLDKTLRENGYNTREDWNLLRQIDRACEDGVITESRRKRAHQEIRVLGNDVLHDEWNEVGIEDVQLSQKYCQRILEDFYDERSEVEAILIEKGRIREVAES